MERNKKRFYYHYDGLGSVTELTSQKQKTTERYEYDSFGNLYRQGNRTKNTYTFTGREFDKETGLYYYRNRYYDPKIGRFITQDPLGMIDGPNLYAYVNNNPVNFVDPLGLYTLIIHGITHHDSGYSRGLGNSLEASGEKIKEVIWSGNLLDFNAFNQIQNEIKQAAAIAKARNEPLNIIGHSWGGVLTSSALRETRIRVENFVTIGTPYFNFNRPSKVVKICKYFCSRGHSRFIIYF